MKKMLFSLALLMSVLHLFGQNDQPTYGYHYQAIIRNGSTPNSPVAANQPVALRFRILTTSNQNLYEETHNATTDQFGRVAMVVGTGTPAGAARFDTLNWAARKHFLDVEVKIGGAGVWAGLGKEEVVHQPFAKWNKDWKNVGDTVLISDGRRIGIGINTPKHDLSVAKGAAFGSRIIPGLNGTENGFSLVHFKNGTDNQGGIIRASKGDEDVPNAPLFYQGKRHVFQGGNVVIDKPNPSLTFLNDNGKAYYWEMSVGVYYLYDPSLAKYRLFFHDNGRVGIGTNVPQADLDVNGDARVKSLTILGNDRAHLLNTTNGKVIPPHTVAVFDETCHGKIRPSTDAYDRKVAGVISDISQTATHRTGIIHAQENTANGSPVAVDGTVVVLATGPIAVGDYLTTSNVPGHAMKAKNKRKSYGAILGKAMTPLAKGEKGKVEMWVERH